MNLGVNYLGRQLINPLVIGACPLTGSPEGVKKLQQHGAAMVVLPSLFEEQFAAERAASNWAMEHGSGIDPDAPTYYDVNSFHLSPDDYFDLVSDIKKVATVPVVGSLNGTSPGNWVMYAQQMQRAGADAIELNIYELAMDGAVTGAAIEDRAVETLRLVKRAVSVPVAVKISPFYSSLANFVRRLDQTGADAVVIFNRFYQPDIKIDDMTVFRHMKYSTSDELPLRLRWAAALHGQIKAQIAITGGAWTAADVVKSLLAGASAVQLCSVLMSEGVEALGVILKNIEVFMKGHGVNNLATLTGKLSLDKVADRRAFERANYVSMLGGK